MYEVEEMVKGMVASGRSSEKGWCSGREGRKGRRCQEWFGNGDT